MTVLLLDGKNLIYRYGYVHKNLTNEDGDQTGALYGVASLLVRAKKHFPDCRFAVGWDGRRATEDGWRKKIYPKYKANRTITASSMTNGDKKLRGEILGQTQVVKNIFQILQIPQIEVDGVEGDDVLSMLAIRCLEQKYKAVIYSSDKDFIQLMPRGVQLIREVCKTSRFKPEDEKSILKLFGCKVKDVLKIRAFLGDSSDGIARAIKGVGPVGALKYIQCGVDPSEASYKEYTGLDTKQALLLFKSWTQLHTNYISMKLVESYNDRCFDDVQQLRLKTRINSVMSQLRNPAHVDKMELMEFLGTYELQEAMGNREILIRLQRREN